MLNIGKKYSIGFPRGITTEMTLSLVHTAKAHHEILYTFLDQSNIKIMFTIGVFNRLKVIELLPPSLTPSPTPSPTLSSTYVNYLFKDDNPIPPPGFAVITPYSREDHNFLSDDDLYS
jgi:hypothetical protein